MDYKRRFENALTEDLFRSYSVSTLIDELEWCGLFVDYWDVFISCLDSHSDGTHSLQIESDTFLQICLDEEKN